MESPALAPRSSLAQRRARARSSGVLSALLSGLALLGCGADVNPYKPSLGGVLYENLDPNAPPQDVSFVDGETIVRTDEKDCGEFTFTALSVFVANQYRLRTVRIRLVDANCTEHELPDAPPGAEIAVSTTVKAVIRIYDASSGSFISAWRIQNLNPIGSDRIVLRSTSPDI
jgi:hypothetical protein